MRKLSFLFATMLIVVIAGCVTINVYFPAAAAEKAAQKFIGNVIDVPDQVVPPASATSTPLPPAAGEPTASVLDWLIPAAHAAQPVDIKISTPRLQALRGSMHARFNAGLKGLLDSGAVGYTNDGMVALRDASAVPLAQRNQVRQTISAENHDRAEVYKAVAAANGHPEWAKKIQKTFAAEWIAQARSGWYYQNPAGKWVKK
ncbi:MAG: YdbL family protein [Xanthomonadales bacterium]|nr:YdbL family protein [Xanthomonadales bacterium]